MSTMDPIVLTVEDAFVIKGRGIVVHPAVDLDRAKPVALAVELTYPDGMNRQVAGRLEIEFVRLLDGTGRGDVRVILDESVGPVPRGTRLVARLANTGSTT